MSSACHNANSPDARILRTSTSALERGEMCDPKISTLRAIARALDLDVLLLVMGRATARETAWPLRTSRKAIESLSEPHLSMLDTLSRPSFATATG
ncbi:hypothetical protein FSB08_10710 [Paraburkholderia sp. JPY432]|uniref:hypothetical protein n=1 Tax=Paraburkholderia youngii TaxID=2782701 RepID=UPI001595862F|nr:hypothetical protein [Paraburkholderia youngii]NVH73035.1 hypothetical protein [Paraburkholderia youngii]